jgi:hypothetical protein
MKSSFKEEIKLMNLIRLLEIYGDGKWGINTLLTNGDKLFLKRKMLEPVNDDYMNETLRNNSRLRVLQIGNQDNWLRYNDKEQEQLRTEIKKGLFNPEFLETDNEIVRELAIGNMIDAMALQSRSGWMQFSKEQTEYLNREIGAYKKEWPIKNL